MGIAISIILLLICALISVVVLLQDSKSSGLSGAISGGAETYFGKNKARTMEGKLETLTKILGGLYLVLSLVLYFILA